MDNIKKNKKGGPRAAIIVAMVALMVAVSVPFLFGADSVEEDQALGSGTSVDITNLSVAEIKQAIEEAAAVADTVTVTGNKTDAGTLLTLLVPDGADVIWKAAYASTGGLEIQGPGSFILDENGSIRSSFIHVLATGRMIVNGDKTFSTDDLMIKVMPYAEMTLNGDMTFTGAQTEIRVEWNAKMTVNGDMAFSCAGYSMIRVYGEMTVNGNVTSTKAGFSIHNENEMEITGSVTAIGFFTNIASTGTLIIGGDLMAEGIFSSVYTNNSLTVRGDVLLLGEFSYMGLHNSGEMVIGGNMVLWGHFSISNGTLTVDGDIEIHDHEYADDIRMTDGTLAVKGNATFTGRNSGIDMMSSEATIDGDVYISGIYGHIWDNGGSSLVIGGNVTFVGDGCVIEMNDSLLTLKGDLTFIGNENSLYAYSDSVVTIAGNVTFRGFDGGLYVQGGTVLTVGGDVALTDLMAFIYADYDGTIVIGGNVTAPNVSIAMSIIAAYGVNSSVTIKGDVTTSGGVYTGENGKLTILGNLKADGIRAIMCNTGEVFIGGNVEGKRTGVYVHKGVVVIDGELTADPKRYIVYDSDNEEGGYMLRSDYSEENITNGFDGYREYVTVNGLVCVKGGGGGDDDDDDGGGDDDDGGGKKNNLEIIMLVSALLILMCAIFSLFIRKNLSK
jgi:flagellar basal body-associated protein FliL